MDSVLRLNKDITFIQEKKYNNETTMHDVYGLSNYGIDTYSLCISKVVSYSSIIYFSYFESALIKV